MFFRSKKQSIFVFSVCLHYLCSHEEDVIYTDDDCRNIASKGMAQGDVTKH